MLQRETRSRMANRNPPNAIHKRTALPSRTALRLIRHNPRRLTLQVVRRRLRLHGLNSGLYRGRQRGDLHHRLLPEPRDPLEEAHGVRRQVATRQAAQAQGRSGRANLCAHLQGDRAHSPKQQCLLETSPCSISQEHKSAQASRSNQRP